MRQQILSGARCSSARLWTFVLDLWGAARKGEEGGMNEPCEAKLEGCQGTAVHRHHILLRSRGGTNDPANLLWTCWNCHNQIHANPKRSTELGLMRHSWEAS